jgi:hypothetical protein
MTLGIQDVVFDASVLGAEVAETGGRLRDTA